MNIPAPFSQNQMRFFWNCFDHWFNVAEGGKRGGKNVLITMAYCTILEKHPSRIHLIAGVSTATARLNILDCDGFGLKNYFEGRCREGTYQNRDCLYIQTATGEKVVLVSGGGKAGDEKLIKGNTYGTAYITEANECSEAFIKEVFDRTLSSPDRKVFHDLNPKAEGHWYYENILNLHEKKQNENPEYGFNYGHFTIADNMSISDDQLRAVLATYDRSTVWYARDILGKRKAAEGLSSPPGRTPTFFTVMLPTSMGSFTCPSTTAPTTPAAWACGSFMMARPCASRKAILTAVPSVCSARTKSTMPSWNA